MADATPTFPSFRQMASSNGAAATASANNTTTQPTASDASQPPATTPTAAATPASPPAPTTPAPAPQEQVTHQQHSPFAPPAAEQPASEAAPESSPQSDTTAAQSATSLVASLRSRGFDVPEGLTDDAALDLITQQIDESNRLAEQYSKPNAPGMTPKTPGTQASPEPSQSAPAIGNNENALPAQPAVGDPASVSAAGAGTPPKLSEEARLFAANGLLKRGENGWVAENPAFQNLADEHTRLDAYRQDRAHKLLDNTDEFISPYVTKLLEERTKPLQEQVERLVAQLESQQTLTQESEIDQWVEQNADALFVNGDKNTLTPYAQQFNTFAAELEQTLTEAGQKPTRADLHNRTVKMMTKLGIVPPAPQPAAPAPEQQQEPRQSFLQAASSTPPFNGTNRLTEYTAATQPTGTPHLPMGPGGTPSLARLIHQKMQNQI